MCLASAAAVCEGIEKMMETPLETGLLQEQGGQGGTRGAPHRRLESNAWSSIQ